MPSTPEQSPQGQHIQLFQAPLSDEPTQTDSSILPTETPVPAPPSRTETPASAPPPEPSRIETPAPTSLPEPTRTETGQQPATPTRPSPAATTAHDEGYVPRGSQRILVRNVWTTSPLDAKFKAPDDVYGDKETFPEKKATVQIVTFFKDGYVGQNPIQAKWESPLKSPLAVEIALRQPQEPRTWRWIHCEGLHGPTMKVIAQETNWSLDKFAGIFQWTRASSEWADGCLLVHFQDQITRIWMLYKKHETNPVFITCTELKHHPGLKRRWEDFVDFGDSRRQLLLRKDPSLMLYCMMRAVIQDLRATAFTTPKDLNELYDIAMRRPSKDSLSHFYGLQQRLIRVTLDTTSLKEAATNLINYIKEMRKESGPESLVSKDTLDRLQDQMGLVNLLSKELPEATRELDGVASLAFNILAFSNNNLLRLLAVLNISSVPLALACAMLSIEFEGRKVTKQTIAIVLCSIGVAVILGVSVFLALGRIKIWVLRRQKTAAEKDKGLEDDPPQDDPPREDSPQDDPTQEDPARDRFADGQARIRRILTERSKRDSMRPDVYSPIRVPSPIDEANPPASGHTTALPPQPRSNNLSRRVTVAVGRWRQPGSPPPSRSTNV